MKFRFDLKHACIALTLLCVEVLIAGCEHTADFAEKLFLLVERHILHIDTEHGFAH